MLGLRYVGRCANFVFGNLTRYHYKTIYPNAKQFSPSQSFALSSLAGNDIHFLTKDSKVIRSQHHVHIKEDGFCHHCNGCGIISKRNYFVVKRRKKVYTKTLVYDGGDLVLDVPDVDNSEMKPGFKDLEILDQLSPEIKKIYSLANSDGRDMLQHRMDQLISKVQLNPTDTMSLEVKIAALTLLIRNQKKHVYEWRKDKKGFSCFKTRIKARNYHLAELRKLDREKFDWLCKELKLTYTPPVSQHEHRILGKRALRKKAARDAFLKTKREKLNALQDELVKARADFDERKECELTELEAEMKALGVEDTSTMEAAFKGLDLEHMLVRPPKIISRRRLMLQRKFTLYGNDKKASLKQKQVG